MKDSQMNMGSMERTLTAKSLNFRQICQWTAATSLVATGAVALFSASTLEKLSQNGSVRLDLEGFHKVGSITLALDRVSDESAFLEEERLMDKALSASAEALPTTKVAFRPITLKKTPVLRKTTKAVSVAAVPAASSFGLTAEEAAEIAMLERARDPEQESAALAQIYRGLRFRFVAASEGLISQDTTLVAGEAYEYDELPEFEAADFILSENSDSRVLASEELDAEFNGEQFVETAPGILTDSPKPSMEPAPSVAAYSMIPPQVLQDSITTAASSPTMAPTAPAAAAIDSIPLSDFEAVKVNPSILEMRDSPSVPVVASPGLDLVPDLSTTELTIQPELPPTSQTTTANLSTGPPEVAKEPEKLNSIETSIAIAAAVNTSVYHAPKTAEEVTVEPLPSAPTHYGDLSEYSADIQSAYVGNEEEDENAAEYSNEQPTVQAGTRSTDASIAVGAPTNDSSFIVRSPQGAPRPGTPPPTVAQHFGSGVSRDSKGITIDWNENTSNGWKANETENGGKIHVGRPDGIVGAKTNPNSPPLSVTDIRDLRKKFSFDSASAIAASQSSAIAGAPKKLEAISTEPTVDTKKCDTVRLGVEALQPGAEKETLAICRRVLSHEGEAAKDQARWWENYNSETGAEHWPTITHQRPSEMNAKDRVPLLSTASIRILSALSRASTHAGMGIVFGRVAQGLDIQLVGRSDAPIYLDAGMKVRDEKSLSATSRQFVFLNVEPGQPLLLVKDGAAGISGSIPLLVKAGMATHLDVSAPQVVGLDLSIFDSSATRETRMANLTAEVIGQAGKLGITNAKGSLRLEKIAVFGDFPIYVDLTQNEKSYKNRFRIGSDVLLAKRPAQNLYFFTEKRVSGWLSQLSGGVSPHSGLIVGVLPSIFTESRPGHTTEARHLKIGILEKKSQLVPERYHLDRQDSLVTESKFLPGYERYIGIQIPEGPCVPTVIDEKGSALWSTLIYAQPGVINVVTP